MSFMTMEREDKEKGWKGEEERCAENMGEKK
jgi:hypothetical protein